MRADAGLTWYVVHTHPRDEAKAAEGLRERGFEVYLPMATRWARVRHRKVKARQRVRFPAFTRYLFVGGVGGVDWLAIKETDGVAGIVCMGDAPVRVAPSEIVAINVAEDMGCFDFTVETVRMIVGGKVMLTAGPLEGYVATVTRAPKSLDKPVEVDVEMFGRSIGAVVPIEHLRLMGA